MTTHIEFSQEQMQAFVKSEIDGPIHMLNLLRYAEDGGRKSYVEYSKHTLPLIEKRGGKVVYRGQGRKTVIGGETWDDILIVEYPSKDVFIEMVTSEEYQKGVHMRNSALEDSRLVCMQTC